MTLKEERFDVQLDVDAAKEYEKLKQPVLKMVNKAIDELVYRADEIGKPLGNKRNMKLAGCKEIKLRDAGIRIIFRLVNSKVEVLQVVQILSIEKRERDYAFKVASSRLKLLEESSFPERIVNRTVKWKPSSRVKKK
ncbi:type II toxin-antitoxin system RelE family toxin [Paenisporosarcina cavernae]|uniref:Addiction module toxin RelE n=1 Tax=Paenisporosarcina cavernae TaxID=2320858 RepID=A0A385YQE2_9BACL|nr:hypothetical protein [Paenisporosarcina cavernae]AYC28969.1 hypothetical protein D3873_03435 [Paenisporosarcina cavernae]